MFAALLLAPLLVFHGNVALLEDVYRSVLDLNGGTKATPANARMVAVRLASFLHRAGYALATVRARVEGEQIVVDIDEGRLDKVIFLGGGAFETLRLRLDLNIEHDVFNQPDLERQLRALGRRLGLGEFAYEIVPVPNVAPAAPRMQLEIDPLEKMSFGLVRPGRPYELHILVQPGKFRPGLSPELEIDSVEGGAIGATYHSGRLIFQDDRWEVGARVAGAVRQRLDGTGSTFKFTRALGEVQYDAPSITGVLRPSLRARGELTDVQRPDLRLESFMFTRLEGGVHLVFAPTGYVRSSLGGGVERRLLFSVEPAVSGSVFSSSYKFAHTRQYAEAALELTFDPDNIRRDRHHLLGIDARVYGPPHEGEESALHLTGWYQKTFSFGWNELWVEGRGISRTGFVLFPEEASIGGSVLRGPFGNEYARKYGGLDLEFRYSLLRDVIKVGIFHNGVAYGAIDRVTNNEKLTFANAVGLGFHALIIDEFQLDAWYGVGWSTKSVFGFDQGGALAIRQAF